MIENRQKVNMAQENNAIGDAKAELEALRAELAGKIAAHPQVPVKRGCTWLHLDAERRKA
jgi:hypothetical protein